MQAETTQRVTLLGLDFGSTTSSALVASAKVARSSATGHMQLDDVQIIYKSEPVFTPFATHNNRQNIDTEKVAKLIANWLNESGVSIKDIFSGGSMITGLAAQADNTTALSKLIIDMVGESVIATADDPCLESWLAFMGSCGALSRYHADVPILNLDIGGGTTNIALGLQGDVLQTGCYFVGARHFKFAPGSYQLLAMSNDGLALLESLNIHKKIGEIFTTNETKKIIAFYIKLLESIVQHNATFLSMPISQLLCQVAIPVSEPISENFSQPRITFSGGVGELIYKIVAGETLPSTTYYGDFGIDLALAISQSTILAADLHSTMPENKGRATVVGLTLHSNEIAGNTVFLPQENCLPLRDLPIIAKLNLAMPDAQWRNAFTLAAKHQHGACIQVELENKASQPVSLNEVQALAQKIKYSIIVSEYAPSQPLLILTEANIGKALGNYICDWGQSMQNIIVIDEVPLRSAHFVHVGRLQQHMIPVSFFGLS